jgi:DNA repair photolyase
LPWEVSPIFVEWLQAHFPDRAERVMNRIREMRGGRDYNAQFGARMTGTGTWASLIEQRFNRAVAKYGLDGELPSLRKDLFQRPRRALPQLDLF